MLSSEDHEILNRVGPGTVMGNLLRRYWTPALLSAELPNPDDPPVRVRLLGEDLVAFRDTDGGVGLVAGNCPHRGASMYFGRNEECGLRCVYHGWKFDVDGNCTDMPSEPRPFAERIRIPAYPTHESGGIVWTYMGPRETMTAFRDFGTDSLPEEHIVARKWHTECNFVQSIEGDLDSVHVSWLHYWKGMDEIPDDGSGKPAPSSRAVSMRNRLLDRAPRIEVQEEWYGFRHAGLRKGPNGTSAGVSAYVIPYCTITGNLPIQAWVVPIDDESCWRYNIAAKEPTPDQPRRGSFAELPKYPYRDRGGELPSGVRRRLYTKENDYLIDREVQRTTTFTGIEDFVSQDLMVTESMGPIYDRTREHLGTIDRAIIALRETLINAAKRLDEGGEAPATGDLDYGSIHGAASILEPGEDWRTLTGASPARD